MALRHAAAWLLGGALSACALASLGDGRDARITAEVQRQLAPYRELQAPNSLDVQTRHGVVYLRGLMATPFQVRLAASVAARVDGVRRVENLIAIENAR